MSVYWMNTNTEVLHDNIPESAKKLTNRVLLSLQDIVKMSDEELSKIETNSDSTREAVWTVLKKKKLLNDPKIAIKLFWIDVIEYYSLFNKSVFNNKDVLLAALSNNADILNLSTFRVPIRTLLTNDFQENKFLADSILKNYVKNNTHISDIEIFISQISWENSQATEELKKMYEKHLKNAHKIHSNDVKNQALLLLSSSNSDIFNLFTSAKIVSKSWEIDANISKLWSKEVSDTFKNNSSEVSKENIVEFLLQKIWLQTKNLKIPEVSSLIDAIYNVLTLQKSWDDADVNLDIDRNDWCEYEWENWKSNTWIDDRDSEKFDYCLNNEHCSFAYSFSWEWNYIIDTWYNNITISKQDYKNFSPNSLENFIKLNALFYQCGLSFILEDKYKKWFFQLMKNRHVGFSAQWWQWFSDFFQLDALNVIANLIWIPKNLYWDDSSIWKFPDKQTAKDAFKSIHSSGNINDENVTKAWWGFLGHSAVQIKLQKIWILWENWWFNSITAEWILKKWWYIENDESKEL